MNGTGYKDKNGKEICIGNEVKYKDQTFDVYVNPFAERLAIDNECGECWLSDVYSECEVI